MAKPSVSKPELRVVTSRADVLSPIAGTGDIGRPRVFDRAALTDQQRAFWELFQGLTKKQQEETFRKLFKLRNQQTAAKAEEEINQ